MSYIYMCDIVYLRLDFRLNTSKDSLSIKLLKNVNM